jgi:quinoprotein glucose dehydrogenase
MMKPTGLFPLIGAITFAFASGSSAMAQNPSTTDWPTYGNDPGGQRYSPLDEINKQNVAHLKVAWTYHTGDVSDGSDGRRWSAFENTPS